MKLRAIFLCLTLASPLVASQAQTQRPQEVFDRAVTDFEQGRVVESAAGFDTVARLVPDLAPQLWQRGIALYYAGRYKDCREQFESHRKGHFLCVARQESPNQARSLMLPVGPDSRVPMRQIDEMFRGRRTPAEVLAAGGNQASGQFYAELYVGLYYEALGNKPLALQHITNAAAPRFAAAGGYMHMVARIHFGILQKQK
jgi:lipoprotein NlpI